MTLPGPLPRMVRSLRTHDPKKILTAIFSEGMLSLSNSVIGILVAKYALKSEYGMYVILFSLIGLLGAYQNSMFNGPMMVLIHHKDPAARKTYVSGLATGMAFAFVPPLALFALGSALYTSWAHLPHAYAVQIAVLCLVILAYMSKEFLRTLNFVNFNTAAIFRMDVVNLIVVFAGLVLLIYLGRISAVTALMVLGTGYLAAFLIAKANSPHAVVAGGRSTRAAVQENWRYGKWAMLGTTCSLVQDRGYIYIVSLLLGLSTLADLSAARFFFMPLGMLNMSTTRIAISKGSELVAQNKRREFRDFLFSFISVLLLIWLAYFVFMMFSANALVGMLLGPKYANTWDIMMLWGVYFFFYTIRYQVCTGLGVYRQFKQTAQIDIFSSTMALTACVLLVKTIGRPGAILALILGECVSMILYLRVYLSFKPESEPVRDELVLSRRLAPKGPRAAH